MKQEMNYDLRLVESNRVLAFITLVWVIAMVSIIIN